MKRLMILLVMFSSCAAAAQPPFDVWIKGIKTEALAQGISAKTASVLDGLQPNPQVVKFDRNQPEFVQTFDDYLNARVTKKKITEARQKYHDNLTILTQIGDKYGVGPAYIVAFWGLESNFGQYQGKYSVVRSLATLAYDQRRSDYFTRELFASLKILDQGHITPDKFLGGWAGAMGQNQFMPSAFLNYAQDFDGDGKKNIWTDNEDVWASIANYLKQNGWQKGAGWGMQVGLSRDIDFDALKPKRARSGCSAFRDQTRPLSIAKWQSLGVTGDFKAASDKRYAMIVPGKGQHTAYLVGDNFDAILRYNCASKYAVSVGLLADYIKAAPK